jgi:hypothetical protein
MLATHFIGNGAIDTAYHDVGTGEAFVLLHFDRHLERVR